MNSSTDRSVAPISGNSVSEEPSTGLVESSARVLDEIRGPPVQSQVAEGSMVSTVRELTERWNLLSTLEWDTNQGFGQVIGTWDLPQFLLVNRKTDINLVQFKAFVYGRFDLHLRLQVNANRYQVGQLQFSWYYHLNDDDSRVSRLSVIACSQRPNVVFQAGTDESCELVIPFKSFLTHFTFRNGSNDEIEIRDFVSVSLNVLSPLVASDGVPKRAYVTVLYRFESSNFMGLSIAEAQMFRSVLRGVEAGLHEINQDINRDYPSDPLRHISVIPAGSHSWAFGTNAISSAHVLRLDALGTTPHRDGKYDEMQVYTVVNRFGLFRIIQWGVGATAELFRIPVTPFSRQLLYPLRAGDASKGLLASYIAPPVMVMASMYALWRGTLEYKFDFVVSMFHTGRLLLAFVPGPPRSVSLTDLMQSYYIIVDVTDRASVTFVPPFVSNRVWRQIDRIDENGIGTVYGYILNSLNAPDNVAKNIDVLMYIKAHSLDFAVPRSPLLGLAKDRRYFNESLARIKSGYTPIYAGAWRDFVGSTRIICRYGEGSDHVTQVVNIKKGEIYVSQPLKQVHYKDGAQNFVEDMKYYVSPRDPAFVGYDYLVPFARLEQAQRYIRSYAESRGAEDHTLALVFVENSASQSCQDWVLFPVWHEPTIEIVDHQGESDSVVPRGTVMEPVQTLRVTGKEFFNEDFMNLKDYCRRFQVYYDGEIQLKRDSRLGQFFLKLPIKFEGLGLDLTQSSRVSEIYNRARDGPIPLITSGYRFFKGGLRFKILISGPRDINVMLVHLATELDGKVEHPTGSGRKDYLSHGYAMYGQTLGVNQIMEVEIPYYLPYEFGLLRGKSGNAYKNSSLGKLGFCFFSELKRDTTVAVQLFYAFADDARVSTFTGFPEVVAVEDVPEHLAQHQGWFSPMEDVKKDIKESVEEVKEAVVEGVDTVTTDFRDTIKYLRSQVSGTLEDVKTGAKSVISDISLILQKAVDIFGGEVKDFLLFCSVEIAHLVVSPTIKTLAIVVGGILLKLGVLSSDYIGKFKDWMCQAYSYFSAPREQAQGATVAEHQGISEEGLCYVSSLIAMISGALRVSMRRPGRSFVRFLAEGLGFELRETLSTANQLLIFFRNNLVVIQKVWYWIFGARYPGSSMVADIVENNATLEQWARRTEYLIRPMNRSKVRSDVVAQRDVFACSVLGSSIVMKAAMSNIDDAKMRLVRSYVGELQKLQTELQEDCLSPTAKFEPFVFQIVGPPGVGKSFMIADVGRSMLKTTNCKFGPELVYTRTPGTVYWNSVGAQPILLYDDFGCTEDILREQIAELFCLKSTAPFNPNIAELQNKKIRYNPLMVAISSNCAFWNSSSVYDPVALYRRRDVLVRTRIRNEVLEQLQGSSKIRNITAAMLPPDVVKDFGHLEFSFAYDPSDKDTEWTEYVSYREFQADINRRFAKYYLKEQQNYLQRLGALFDGFPTDGAISIDDLAAMLSQDLGDFEWLHSVSPQDFFSTCVAQNNKLAVHQATMEPFDPSPENPLVDNEAFKAYKVMRSSCLGTRVQEFYKTRKVPWVGDITCCHSAIDGSYEFYRPRKQKYGYWFRSTLELLEMSVENMQRIGIIEKQCAQCIMNFPENKEILASFAYERIGSRGNVCDYSLVPLILRELHDMDVLNLGDFEQPEERRPVFSMTEEIKKAYEKLCTLGYKMYTWLKGAIKWIAIGLGAVGLYYTNPFRGGGVTEPPVGDAQEFVQSFVAQPEEFEQQGFFGLGGDPRSLVWESDMSSTGYGRIPVGSRASKVAGVATLHLSNATGGPDMARLDFDRMAYNVYRLDDILKVGSGCANDEIRVGDTEEDDQSGQNGVLREGERVVDTNNSTSFLSVPDHQYTPSGDVSTRAPKSRRGVKTSESVRRALKGVKFAENRVVHQGQMDDDIRNLLAHNMGVIRVNYRGREIGGHRFLGICGRFIIVTRHLLECVHSDAFYDVTVRRVASRIRPDRCRSFGCPESSVAILELPKEFPAFRDITHLFATLSEHDYAPFEAHVGIASGKDSVEWCATKIEVWNNLHIAGRGAISSQDMECVYRHSISRTGICGAPIIGYVRHKLKIIGIHIAGNERYGYAQPVSCDQFAEFRNKGESVVIPQGVCQSDGDDDRNFDGVWVLGRVPPELNVGSSGTSKIVKSDAFNSIRPVTTEPAPLTQWDPRVRGIFDRSPLMYGLERVRGELRELNDESFNRAVEGFKEKILSVVRPKCQKEEISDVDIFCGIPGLMKALKLDTSEGFPLVLERPQGRSDKRWLFNFEEEDNKRKFIGLHDEFRKILAHNAKLRQAGEIPFSVFVDTLKDARIPKEKVTIPGKTRLFSCAPIELNWTVKKYMGNFMMAYGNNFLAENAIGINPDSMQWTDLVSTLNMGLNDPLYLVGDYEQFGDKLQPRFILAAFEIIESWYKKYFPDTKNTGLRSILAQEVVHPIRLADGMLYRTMTGIPSGFGLTVEINSIVNSLYLRYSYFENARKKGLVSSNRDFERNVVVVTYGDDVIVGIDRGFIEKFNGQIHAQCMEEIGVKFTNEEKSGPPVEKSLLDCSFLKRKFKVHPYRKAVYLGELPESSVYDCLNWHWDVSDRRKALLDNCRATLENAYSLGEERYNALRADLILYWSEQSEDLFFHADSWRELDNKKFGVGG